MTRLYRHAKANYLLLNDNLADLLHVAYLHIPSGGGNGYMGAAEANLKVEDQGYHFVRQTKNIPAPAGYGRLSSAKGNVDRWQSRAQRPFVLSHLYRRCRNRPGGPDSTLPMGKGRWTIAPHHFVTPETEKTTHYFQVVGHEWAPSSDSWRFLNSVIDEDVWAIEHQQTNIDLEPDAPTRPIASDGPMLAMRKIVERMLASETADAVTLELALEQALNGVQLGLMLFLLAAGLTLVLGIMNTLNLTHGSLYMLGAYIGASTLGASGSFLVAAAAGIAGVVLVAALVEVLVMKHLYDRDHLTRCSPPSACCCSSTRPPP